MGAIFRLRLAVGDPAAVANAAVAAGVRLLGLAAKGEPLDDQDWISPRRWSWGTNGTVWGAGKPAARACSGIPMAGSAESLSAAVAGSIVLYEATRRGPGR